MRVYFFENQSSRRVERVPSAMLVASLAGSLFWPSGGFTSVQ